MKFFLRNTIIKASSRPLSYCNFKKAVRVKDQKWQILHNHYNIIVEGDPNNAFG